MVDAVDLDDRHVVAVDGERMVRVAGHRHETEAVALALGDRNHRKLSVHTGGVSRAAEAVDERSVRSTV